MVDPRACGVNRAYPKIQPDSVGRSPRMRGKLNFLFQPEVLGVIAVVIVFAIGLWGKKLLNHFRLIFQVWHLVEKMGILAGLKGYEKLALAMDVGRSPRMRGKLFVAIFHIVCPRSIPAHAG